VENRKIIHIDMDAFFAAVEQRDFPEYRGRPVIVGGAPDSRGVVAACSYEARKFGIHSAMPSSRAWRLCPHAIFLRPRFSMYRRVSNEIRQIFQTVTELIEPLSLDEAFLDVTDCPHCNGSATRIARKIKQAIRDRTRLTASAGVSYNKFLAKIASDMDKPDGLFLITPEQGPSFIEQLPVRKFFGIGKATEAKMKSLGIHTGADLKSFSLEQLQYTFGKVGKFYYQIARGNDPRPVNRHRARKSIGTETTFEHDLDDTDQMMEILNRLAEKVINGLQEKNFMARTITLKVKYDDFELITRSHTQDDPFVDVDRIINKIADLLVKTEAGKRKVRLLGITASNLMPISNDPYEEQLGLF
jgi:DNA polymerase-4